MRSGKRPSAAGGWRSIWYTVQQARRVGGIWRMWSALRAPNACKTCALGMGGQQGGMRNEAGRFPEVCKKSVQAMAADMAGAIRDGFFDTFPFDKLARLSPRELEAAGRVTSPLYAGPGDRGYRPIGWDEALDRVAAALRHTPPDESFFYFSGRSSNEAAFLLQLFARLYGTNNVNNCSYFCHQASGHALAGAIGVGTATVTLEDLDGCDLLLLIGGNPASNHPRLMRTIVDIRRRGGKVIVVNPIREVGLVNFKVPSDVRSLLFGSRISDEYVQTHIGGDIAFMYGVAKSLIQRGAIDRAFIGQHTDGWEAFAAQAGATSWEDIEQASGVARSQIEKVAELYAASKAAVFAWTMGMTHHRHGADNVRMIINLALMRGMVGKPSAGLLPLRGHSNVQGIGSMGATPRLSATVARAIEQRLGVRLPEGRGLDTLACVQQAAQGRMRLAFHLGGNLFGSCPDANAAEQSLSKVGLTVFLSTTLNTGHARGRGRESIILPVKARDEEAQPTTQESMFNFVRISEGGKPRYDGPMGEVQLVAQLAHRVLGDAPVDFRPFENHARVRELIAASVPGYAPIGKVETDRQEFRVQGRSVEGGRFATPSGRAHFHAPAIPAPAVGPDELTLMTIRSEGQFNTVVYEEEDVYRGQERRDVVLLHTADIARLGLRVDDRVTLRSSAGEMRDLLVREFDIRPGNAAVYYPEANVLVPPDVDSGSRTPAFKSVAVRIEKSTALPVVR